MKSIRYFFLFSVILLSSCKDKSNPTAYQLDYGNLIQSWTNSFEEQTDNVQVYRPSQSMQFPPARYREILQFSQDSSCNYLVLSPKDAHYLQSGRWSIIASAKIAIFDTSHVIYKAMQIVELKQNVLRVIIVN